MYEIAFSAQAAGVLRTRISATAFHSGLVRQLRHAGDE